MTLIWTKPSYVSTRRLKLPVTMHSPHSRAGVDSGPKLYVLLCYI